MTEFTIILNSIGKTLMESLIKSISYRKWLNDDLLFKPKKSTIKVTPEEFVKLYEKNGDKIIRSQIMPPSLGENNLGQILIELEH